MFNPLPHGVLAGIRVIDTSVAGDRPHCAQVLADWGADVLKIAPPPVAECSAWGPVQPDPEPADAAPLPLRTMQLDLTREPGRDMLLRLLADADVLIESFDPGALAQWGLGHATLLRRFPRLVQCRVGDPASTDSAGSAGSAGRRQGAAAPADSHAHLQALDGLRPPAGSAAIHPFGPLGAAPAGSLANQQDPLARPMAPGTPGVWAAQAGQAAQAGLAIQAEQAEQAAQRAALAVLGLLQDRQHSGGGGFVDAALAHAGITVLRPRHGANASPDTPSAPAGGAASQPDIHCHEMLATATEPVFLAWGDDSQFARLCQHLGRPAWVQDPRFASAPARASHRAALKAALEACLAAHDGAMLADALCALGVPCTPVVGMPEALSAAQAQSLGYKPPHVR